MASGPTPQRTRASSHRLILAAGVFALLAVALLLRFAVVTDHMVHALVKDPERTAPEGRVIVAPADGTVLYVERVRDGEVPQMVKRGVAVPLVDHLKLDPDTRFPDGWLVGIYMNTDGVHVNRAPLAATLAGRTVFNGPHMDMSAAERTILLTQLVPGWVSLKKMLGVAPYDIADEADFVLKSARETLRFRDARDADLYVTRIADFYVGKILTWVSAGEEVATGQKLGMITWGSQTDVFFAESEGLELRARVGEFVYAGESVLATY